MSKNEKLQRKKSKLCKIPVQRATTVNDLNKITRSFPCKHIHKDTYLQRWYHIY